MKKKILVKGPALSRSGYGEQTRFALRALRTYEEYLDIYLLNIPWGTTGFILADTEEYHWLEELMFKTEAHVRHGDGSVVPARQAFDISLQVTIPNEFERIAPINIGYTAGIETTKVAPIWLAKGNDMDKLIVVSNHSKQVYETSTCIARNNDTGEEKTDYRCETPIEVISYAVRNFEPESVEGFKLDYDFNFITVAQWGPRKNLDSTIRWFVEEFSNDEVGLVVKTNMAKDSLIDRRYVFDSLRRLLSLYPDRKCKIYLLHGTLTDGNMTWLYQHKKVKGMISLSHGEGFGLPLFEAAYNGVPLVTTDWSGQTDFINMPNKNGKIRPHIAKVKYSLQPVQPEVVWKDVIEADSMWAYPIEASAKSVMREVYKNHGRFKAQARRLQKWVLKNFTEKEKYAAFAELIISKEEIEMSNQIEEMFKDLSI